jgi:hypothetical protein
MSTLFRKALGLGDLHFGRSGNSPQANQDNLDFLNWAIDEARTWGAETAIMLGDWHDNRHSLGITTMLASLDGMDLMNAAFKHILWLPGNHDLVHKVRRDAASIEFARWLPNVAIIREPILVDDVWLLPWLLPGETIQLTGARYSFGHAPIAGFLRNAKSVMPESDDALKAEQFAGLEYGFNGHFHKRQLQGNVWYIGNIMPFNHSDDNDAERGIMLLEWGKEPIFRAWPDQPLYHSVCLSDLLDNTKILKPHMTLRLAVDLPLQYEEAQELRDGLIAAYGLRRIELNHVRDEVDQETNDVEFQTVDQLVLASLEDIQSVGLSNPRLIEIYQSLI